MKILILTNNGEGLYKFRKELIEELLKNNEVFISLPEDNYIDKLTKLGCSFIKTEFNRKGTNPIKDIKLFNFYKNIINEIKPNVIFTYTIKPSVYGGLASKKYNIPYIVNITGLGSSIENGGILSKISLFLYKIGINKAQKVFFQNETNRTFMLNKKIVSKGNSDLLPGSGVNLDEYKLLEYSKKDTIDFVYIGRIMKEKGIEQYLNAASYINSKYENTRFHIAGEYEDDYQNEINELINKGIIIFHGSIENMVDEIYSKCDCVVHPSYYAEGLSNVLLEASACGRPIITTDRPGCREVIEDNLNGFIVKQKDEKDLEDKIEKFIKLPFEKRKEMGINGRKKVEKEFNRNIVINKYLEELEKIK